MIVNYSRLTAEEAGTLHPDTVLCLPAGSHEQHGPHLPLGTDAVIAEQFTARLAERYHDRHHLCVLPALPYGLSLEHAWAPGTISLRLAGYAALLDAIVREYVRATPARRLLIVNGHGGNRGILEAALYELAGTHQVRACVIHPSSLATVAQHGEIPEVHAGARETSVMLALAPDQVHLDRLDASHVPDLAIRSEVNRLILHRGTTWPWTSGDPRIAVAGITGDDPRTATAERGNTIVNSALDACAAILDDLRTPLAPPGEHHAPDRR